MHISCMEVLNKYLGILPTIKNSPVAVASMEMGYVPFTEVTHASIILSHLPVAWRNQYGLMHKTVPELPCAMLQDLENIKKLFVEKYNKKAHTYKAKAATAPKMAERAPKKRSMGEGLIEEPPKRAVLHSIASGARQQMGHTTHNTIKCCKFEKDSMPKDKPVKPYDFKKKPWKKTDSGVSSQMAYLTEKVAKLKKKLKKIIKHIKKHARDS